MNTDYKNKLFTAFCVLLSLFLTVLFLIEQKQASYRENVDKMLKAQEQKYKLLKQRTEILKHEMKLIKLDTLLARANGIDYRGLMNQTPTTY